jgi:hypothetical protein
MIPHETDHPIVELARKAGLPELLARWEPLPEEDQFPEIDDAPARDEDIFEPKR